jgi:diguanylate cyclase (GGDEF)-like protein
MRKTFSTAGNVRLFSLAGATLVFLLFIALGELFLGYQGSEQKHKQRMETIAHTSLLRARVERELNSLLYLSSGLGSYLVVRNDSIRAKEINDILAVLHRSSRHVRNFGVAIGHRLTFVYPLKGNEKAIGLYYPSQPLQWPVIKRIIESGKPALAGPVQLVQGGSGLIYRVPLSISGKYWGLLSTVIDTESLFTPIYEEFGDHRFEFAVRGKDGRGAGGEMVWGDVALFADKAAVVQEVEVPGGTWAIGVRAKANGNRGYATAVRLLGLLLGGLIAWMAYQLIRNRADLAHLAMYDQLTGLPNRYLFEDRVRMALARQRRAPGQVCALLFLDLDGFKEINDNFGHKAGDIVLSVAAERARGIVRQNDTVARWGGDEFIILIENATQTAVDNYIQRLREKIEMPIDCDGVPLTVGVSIGYVMHSETSGDLDEMLKMADHRMYADKNRRK